MKATWRRRSAKLAWSCKATSPSTLRKRLRFASSAGFSARRRSRPLRYRLSSFRQAMLAGRHRASALGQAPPPSTCNSTPNAPVKCYEHLTGPRIQAPSRAHARYSNDREFSTRQHAEKLPSVLKGNRKRIGKKAAQSNAERSGARGRLTISTETPLNAQGSRTPHEAPPDKRPARKSCGAPSESRPARKPQSTQPESWLARKPITASDERAKPQTGAKQARRKPPDIMAHRAAQRRGGGFRYVRERSNAAAA